MELFIILLLVLAVLLVVLMLYLGSLKRQIRTIRKELAATRELSYNRQLAIALFDQDLTDMTTQLNDNLDYQKQLKLKYEQSQRQMKQSIADIAHDLRTPLTVLKGNLQMLKKEASLTGKSGDYLRISLEKTDLLRDMVDDFFELSVLESDRMSVELQTIPVTNYLMQFLLEHETVIRQHGLTPELRFPEKSIFIKADPTMLERMLGNLLSNVLKYAQSSFTLSLVCEDFEKYCDISFSNQVSAEYPFEVEHLFDRSYQGDKARKAAGAGLGLYIVKLLAQKQGAGVSASCEEGELTLSIRFPVCPERQEPK
ncbi:MAG: sensor histidine kinase [Lachnospiraceae bacterium]|nr:sensor histidine kinase [Lachnospiraceae bacterium]